MSELFDFQVAGLPMHVLLVHVIVVGVPLLALLLIVLAAWPTARRVLWIPALIGAVLLLGLTWLTVEAGEWLVERVPETPLIEEHADQGDDLLPWVIALVAVAALIGALAIVERRAALKVTDAEVAVARGVSTPARRSPVRVVIAILLLVAAIGVGVGAVWTTVRIGEAGSRAVWEGSFSDVPLEDR
ncbi:hypothetical protein [Agromyces kandeliae]|uniref:Uncharacterized protein n=1 Tax=Agromyces kandeliae TaxID=2666141 RepID=A0A6L5R759_9MICO|nr:hypothetical protein [Agromyces kandeliae]MRX45057.1 hypothetical protein [Agromyces kandeliae]